MTTPAERFDRELIEALHAGHTELARKERLGHSDFPFRGSALGACPRKLALSATGLDKTPLTLRAQRTFQTGTDAGERHQAALKAAWGDAFTPERVAYVPLPVAEEDRTAVADAYEEHWGNLDDDEEPVLDIERMAVRTRLDGAIQGVGLEVHTLEIKTKHPFGFSSLTKEGVGRDYLIQVLAGRYALEQEGLKVGETRFLFEHKGEHRLLTLDPFDDPGYRDGMLEEALAEQAAALVAWAKDRADDVPPGFPARPGDKKLDWHCSYCDIGPLRGNCFPHLALEDTSTPSKPAPIWTIRSWSADHDE